MLYPIELRRQKKSLGIIIFLITMSRIAVRWGASRILGDLDEPKRDARDLPPALPLLRRIAGLMMTRSQQIFLNQQTVGSTGYGLIWGSRQQLLDRFGRYRPVDAFIHVSMQ